MRWVNAANLQYACIATLIIVLIENFVAKFEIAFSRGSNEC